MGRQNSLPEVILDRRVPSLPQIDQVRKMTAQTVRILGPLLSTKSDLPIRNVVLLYKQLIRPMMDYACPAWRSAARSHVRRLHVLQWCPLLRNMQIHEDLGVPLFAEHIRALTASIDSKTADVENPNVRKLGRYLHWPRVETGVWGVRQGWQGPAGKSRTSPAMAKSTKWFAFGSDQPSVFRIPWMRFSVIFLSCKEMSGYIMWSRCTALTPLLRRGGFT